MNNKDKENLIRAARAGGKIIRKFYGKTLHITEKSAVWDLQTEADLESEKVILRILKNKFQKYNTHSEETGRENKNSDFTFIIDPLDGTNNFVMGIPNFTVSIALFYKNEPLAEVIYQPILNQTFFAEKNKGAWLDGKKIKVSKINDADRMTLAYTCGYKSKRPYVAKMMSSLINSPNKRVTLNWSPAYDYCMLALGKIESVITDKGIEIHDYAASKLIAQEAGAKVIDFQGQREKKYVSESFIISNNDKTNKHVFKIIKPLQKK